MLSTGGYASALPPALEAHTIIVGDFNIAPADEGRMEVDTGQIQFDDGRDS